LQRGLSAIDDAEKFIGTAQELAARHGLDLHREAIVALMRANQEQFATRRRMR
jgi:hypothetical protein